MRPPATLVLLALVGAAAAFPTAGARAVPANMSSLSGVFGVDVSQPVSGSEFTCMVNDGFSFAVVRAFRSTCEPDPAAPGTITAAWSAGMAHVDAYFFANQHCGNAAGMMESALSHLSSTHYGMLWLDIEGGSSYWSGDVSENVDYVEQLIKTAESHGVQLGIYSSASQWSEIFGSGVTQFSDLPIW